MARTKLFNSEYPIWADISTATSGSYGDKYFTVRVTFRIRKDEELQWSAWMNTGNPLYNFQVKAQWNKGEVKDYDGETSTVLYGPYGYRLEHDSVIESTSDAEAVLKVFKWWDKVLEDAAIHPENFVQFVQLLCSAAGVDYCTINKGSEHWRIKTSLKYAMDQEVANACTKM